MTLKNLVERECRWHGYMNVDGTIADDIAVITTRETILSHHMDFRRLGRELYLGSMRVIIEENGDDGLLKVIEAEREMPKHANKMGCKSKNT